jgi:hypothetical protein
MTAKKLKADYPRPEDWRTGSYSGMHKIRERKAIPSFISHIYETAPGTTGFSFLAYVLQQSG